MAVPSNTSTTYSAVGIREDLSNVIYNIAPMDTPFFSGCGRTTADSTKFEWQTDTIAAGSTNQQIEGNDPSNDARANPVRLNNYTQISVYTIQTSGTNQAVDYAGRKNSQAYQLAKKAKQMKRDIEYMLTNNVVKAVGDSTEARKSAGISTWLNTGYLSNNSTSGSPTAGSLGTTAPANVSVPMRTAANGPKPAHVISAVDVYVSDFGTFKIVSDRNQFRDRDVFFIDFDYWSVAYLRPFKTEALAKSGDSVRQMLVVEYGLEAKNQASSGTLADVKA